MSVWAELGTRDVFDPCLRGPFDLLLLVACPDGASVHQDPASPGDTPSVSPLLGGRAGGGQGCNVPLLLGLGGAKIGV